ncbi:unnamed protein product [Brachionus calyciflorus]|uniref:Arrestin C-terminal-like domain-containing protein n=1 Tax=Brachionus calyciflorus TaxID=104777 RepID=A0A813LY42_9BILA|nr:unnamed protein product [Brachionus calyciflorus]
MIDIEYFDIRFDNENSLYYAGNYLKGTLDLVIKNRTKVTSLKLVLTGKGETIWSVFAGETPIAQYDSEEYLRKEQIILSSDKKKDLFLDPGNYTYKFEIPLPSNLPSSFKNSIGKINYEIEAIIDRPLSLKKHVIKSFTVFSHMDLSMQPNLKEVCKVNDPKIVLSTGLRSHFIIADFRINKGGYVPFEKIEFDVNLENKSNRELKEMSVCLVQCFKSFKGAFVENKVITSVNYSNRINDNSKQKWTAAIIVPVVCPSSAEICKIMEIKYQVVLKLTVSGISTTKNMEIPITIGTHPVN